MVGPTPSRAALGPHDGGTLEAKSQLGRLRSQAAVIRSLADCVEHLSRAADNEGVGDQLIEELACLGCKLIETAAALAGSQQPETTGVFARQSSPCPSSHSGPMHLPPGELARVQVSGV